MSSHLKDTKLGASATLDGREFQLQTVEADQVCDRKVNCFNKADFEALKGELREAKDEFIGSP